MKQFLLHAGQYTVVACGLVLVGVALLVMWPVGVYVYHRHESKALSLDRARRDN